jgi:hypothetical protein
MEAALDVSTGFTVKACRAVCAAAARLDGNSDRSGGAANSDV